MKLSLACMCAVNIMVILRLVFALFRVSHLLHLKLHLVPLEWCRCRRRQRSLNGLLKMAFIFLHFLSCINARLAHTNSSPTCTCMYAHNPFYDCKCVVFEDLTSFPFYQTMGQMCTLCACVNRLFLHIVFAFSAPGLGSFVEDSFRSHLPSISEPPLRFCTGDEGQVFLPAR